MNIKNKIAVCTDAETFKKVLPDLEHAICVRLKCAISVRVPDENTVALLCITSKDVPCGSMKKSKETAESLNVPVVEIDASIAGETVIYELLKLFVDDDNTNDVNDLLQVDFPQAVIHRDNVNINNNKSNDCVPNTRSSTSTVKLVLLFLCIILIIILSFRILHMNVTITDQSSEILGLNKLYYDKDGDYRSLSIENDKLRDDYNQLEQEFTDISEYVPFIIKNVDVGNRDLDGNMETDFGKTIHSPRTQYLVPRIHYYGLKSESLPLDIKLHLPSGTIYSYKDTIRFYKGVNKVSNKGFGYPNASDHYLSGQYYYEFFYNGDLLYTKHFTID